MALMLKEAEFVKILQVGKIGLASLAAIVLTTMELWIQVSQVFVANEMMGKVKLENVDFAVLVVASFQTMVDPYK